MYDDPGSCLRRGGLLGSGLADTQSLSRCTCCAGLPVAVTAAFPSPAAEEPFTFLYPASWVRRKNIQREGLAISDYGVRWLAWRQLTMLKEAIGTRLQQCSGERQRIKFSASQSLSLASSC